MTLGDKYFSALFDPLLLSSSQTQRPVNGVLHGLMRLKGLNYSFQNRSSFFMHAVSVRSHAQPRPKIPKQSEPTSDSNPLYWQKKKRKEKKRKRQPHFLQEAGRKRREECSDAYLKK
mmetsp:Transcript_36529/g.71842  ORF Transcript_36529/g.71842 Transcript_36529/m.71842 type:complete len:117 (+) Transcript_36529:622-972(+)